MRGKIAEPVTTLHMSRAFGAGTAVMLANERNNRAGLRKIAEKRNLGKFRFLDPIYFFIDVIKNT
jgi:hypothetical protein